MNHILIIETDPSSSENFSGLLKDHKYEVDCAFGGYDALSLLESKRYGLVITDFCMRDMEITQFLSQVSQCSSFTNVLIATDKDNVGSTINILKQGAYGYITKPINPEEFLHSVAQSLEQRRMQHENIELKNMLNLFQASQAIAGCLETERIYHLLLDAVAKEADVSRYMGLFQSGKDLDALQTKDIAPEIADHFKKIILTHITNGLTDSALMTHITDVAKTPAMLEAGIKEAFLIFMRNNYGLLQGVMVLLNNPGMKLPDFHTMKENILFLMEQSLRPFENARNYHLANEMLFIDDLSGLYNYRYLEIALDRELKRIERYSSQLAILFLDLDSFKQVNDTHGHLVGSQVLKEVGSLLKMSVRDVDVVIRYGGDEYTIILVETTPEAAVSVAERVRKQVESHSFLAERGLNIKVTCSIGYSCCPEDTLNKHELLEMADNAMYAGKGSGKNCVIRHKKAS